MFASSSLLLLCIICRLFVDAASALHLPPIVQFVLKHKVACESTLQALDIAYSKVKEKVIQGENEFPDLQSAISCLKLNEEESVLLSDILMAKVQVSIIIDEFDLKVQRYPSKQCSSPDDLAHQLGFYAQIGRQLSFQTECIEEVSACVSSLVRVIELIVQMVDSLNLADKDLLIFSQSLLLTHRTLMVLRLQGKDDSDKVEEERGVDLYSASKTKLFETHDLESRRPLQLEHDKLMYQVMLIIQNTILKGSKLSKNYGTALFRSNVHEELTRHILFFCKDIDASREQFINSLETNIPKKQTKIYEQLLKYVPKTTTFKRSLIKLFDRYTEQYRVLLYLGVDEWRTVREQPFAILVHLCRLSINPLVLIRLCTIQMELLSQISVVFREYEAYGFKLPLDIKQFLDYEVSATSKTLQIFIKYSDHSRIDPFIPPSQVSLQSFHLASLIPDAFFLLFEAHCALPVLKKTLLRCKLESWFSSFAHSLFGTNIFSNQIDRSLNDIHLNQCKLESFTLIVEELNHAQLDSAHLKALIELYMNRLVFGLPRGFFDKIPIGCKATKYADLVKKHSAHLSTILYVNCKPNTQFKADFALYFKLVRDELAVLKKAGLSRELVDDFCIHLCLSC